MKKIISFFIAICSFDCVFSQIDENSQWSWESGDNTSYSVAVYGTKGIPSSTNNPGARQGAVSWTDADGNLWLMGGVRSVSIGSGFLNDLWKYKPLTNEWTWVSGDNTFFPAPGSYGMKGVSSSMNQPGARHTAVSWIDVSGNLWLMGGFGNGYNGSGFLNDLWKFNPSTNQWTWVSGDNLINQAGVYGDKGVASFNNRPGARFGALGWVDPKGDLLMFGGGGTNNPYGFGLFNDLWKYDIANNAWTWISGDNSFNQVGSYGTKGLSSSTNKPGARESGVGWIDVSGNLWTMGGVGVDVFNTNKIYNDLWKYNPSLNEWTWVSGDNTFSQAGIYGTRGVPSSTTKPGARYAGVSWIDVSGDLWLMGGGNYGSNKGNTVDFFNDLWKYSPSTNQWTWVSGDAVTNQSGVYGTKGISSSMNKPGARYGSISWIDVIGNFWLLGGYGIDASASLGYLSDLWKVNLYTLTCPANKSVNTDLGACTSVVSDIDPAITPAGNVANYTLTGATVASGSGTATGQILNKGLTTVTYSLATEPGKTCAFIVTVIDNQPPTIVAPASLSMNADAGNCSASGVALGNPTTGDNCEVSVTNDAPAIFPVGSTTVTWTATDASGNSTTATQTVTVSDIEKPVLTYPASDTICKNTYAIIPPLLATDNCGIATVTYSINGATNRIGSGLDASGSMDPGISTIVWTVTDVHGNWNTIQSVLTVDKQLTATIENHFAGPNQTMLIVNWEGGSAKPTFLWSDGSFQPSIIVSSTSTSSYSVTVTDKLGCSATASTQLNVSAIASKSNIQEQHNSGSLAMQAIPNVSKSYFTLNIRSSNLTVQAHLILYDILGKVVEQRSVTPGQTIQLGSAYRPGIYYAELIQGKRKVTVKLIKSSR
jgi:N-acetylneuraminic acid mutarotase